jgi:hypothetical protein
LLTNIVSAPEVEFRGHLGLVLVAVALAALSEHPLTAGVLAWSFVVPITAFHSRRRWTKQAGEFAEAVVAQLLCCAV